MPNLIVPGDAFRLLLFALDHETGSKFADKITSYYWFWRWKTLGIPAPAHTVAKNALEILRVNVKNGDIRLRGVLLAQNPPAEIDPADCMDGELDVFDQTLRVYARAQDVTPARIYRQVRCVESDVKKIVRGASTALIRASDEEIHAEIAAVYAEAQPNINELPAPVQARLKIRGLDASGHRIKILGSEQKYRLHRRPAGQRST